MLWVDEHAPSAPACVVGNTVQATTLVNHLAAWARSPKGAAPSILLSGPPGVGKSASIAIAAKLLGFEVVELNSSMQRTHSVLEQILSNYVRLPGGLVPRALLEDDDRENKPAIISIEEADGLDRGGMQYLLQFIKQSSVPVVLTCNLEIKDPKMRTLASHCSHTITFSLPSRQDVITILLSILATRLARAMTAAERLLADRAYDGSNGDPRSAINRLQLLCTDTKLAAPAQAPKQEEDLSARFNNLFEFGRAAFQGQMSIDQSVAEITSDSFLYCGTIWSNYPAQCPIDDLERLARASEAMSLSDTYEGTAKGGNYALDTQRIVAGPITAAYHTRRPTPASCEFPSLLSHLSKVSKINRTLKSVARRMRTVHTETDEAGKAWQDPGLLYTLHDVTKDLAKNICLCVGRLLREDNIEAACDILVHYSLDMEDLDTIRTAGTWLDPLSGGQMRPAMPAEALKKLEKRLKELRPAVVRTTFCEIVTLELENLQEEAAEVEVVAEDSPEPARKQQRTSSVKRARGK